MSRRYPKEYILILLFSVSLGFFSCKTIDTVIQTSDIADVPVPEAPVVQEEVDPTEGMTEEQKKFYKLSKTYDYDVVGLDLDYKLIVDDEEKEVILQFEETDSSEDWKNNKLCFPWPLNLDGQIIWTTYGYARIYKSANNVPLEEFCKQLEAHPDYKSVIRGWSLGSAIAKIVARHYLIRAPKGTKIDEFTTFGDVKCWANPFFSLKKYCNVIREYVNPNDLVTWSMLFYRRDVTNKVGDKFSFKKARQTEYYHTHYHECDYSKWTDN